LLKPWATAMKQQQQNCVKSATGSRFGHQFDPHATKSYCAMVMMPRGLLHFLLSTRPVPPDHVACTAAWCCCGHSWWTSPQFPHGNANENANENANGDGV